MPDKSKFEREIDKILEQSESGTTDSTARPRSSDRRRSFEPFSPNVPKRKKPNRAAKIKINPGNVIIGGVLLLAVAAFTPVAKIPLAILGMALAITGYVLWFRSGTPGTRNLGARRGLFGRSGETKKSQKIEPQVKYWRGRRIDEKPTQQHRGKIIDFRAPDDDRDDKQ